MGKKVKKSSTNRRSPESWEYWVQRYPTGSLCDLLFSADEVKRKKCIEKCMGEQTYGRFIKVRITEVL